MNALPAQAVPLLLHPACAWQPALQLGVSLAVAGSPAGAGLLLTYRLTAAAAELAALHVPAAETPGPADGLWQRSCFELFVATEGHEAYREFNFSPSGQWACYHFDRERERTPGQDLPSMPLVPEVQWQTGAAPVLQAWLPAELLPPRRPWRVGLSAVLAHVDGRLAYLALSHPKERPDFHDRRGWTLQPALPPFPAGR